MKEIRNSVRELIIRKGIKNIINADVAEIAKKHDSDIFAVLNALNYFEFSTQQAKFRSEHGF